jgi:hypothetical protein
MDDDAAVALISAPAELGHMPLSEPLVDVFATLEVLSTLALISADEAHALQASARTTFFKDRTVASIVTGAKLGERTNPVLAAYREHHRSQKRADALELVRAIAELPDVRTPPPQWKLKVSPFFSPALVDNRSDQIGV